MTHRFLLHLARSAVGAGALGLLLSTQVWGQAPPPPPPTDAADAADAVKDTADDAQDAANEKADQAKEKAKDAQKDAQKDAKDAAAKQKDAAKEKAKDTTSAAKGAARDAKDASKTATKDTQDAARDAKDNAKASAKDAQNAAKDRAKDATRSAKDAAKSTTKDAKETAEDLSDDADPRATDAKDTAKTRTGTRTGDARESAKDGTLPARDRRARDARDARDTADDDTPASERANARSTRDSRRDGQRDTANLESDANANAGFQASNMRAADMGLWFDNSINDGLMISDVATSGAIAQLGFREGDRIVSVNGQQVAREADFIQYLFANNATSNQVRVVVLRDNREQVITVNPTVFVEEYQYVDNDPLEHFGVILDDRYDDQLVVWRVIPRSPAFYAGIRAGDVLTSFRGQPLTTRDAFVTTITDLQPGAVPVQVRRNDRVRNLQVDYPAYQARSERRTALMPAADVERASQLREERIEDRRNSRRINRAERADEQPVLETTPQPVLEPAPGQPAQPVQPRRPGLLPRNRGGALPPRR